MSKQNRREQIQEMLKDEPNDAFLLYGLAMEYLSENDEKQAEKAFGDLIQRNPEYPPGYLQLGQLQARLGKEEQARLTYQSGIAVARKVGDAHAAGEMENFLNLLD
ncbi:MAG: tetratricopeptide repeat protein [Gemmataceae bacterium]